MRLFSCESVFNAKTNRWEERFWIDGCVVDGDLYFFELEREKDLEIQKLAEAIELEAEECDCPICVIDKYTQQIVDITGGCPNCISSILEEFMFQVIEHIEIEYVEDIEEGQLN